MDWGTIIVAAIAALGPLIGTIISNNKQKALVVYRMDLLEKRVTSLSDKVDKHNSFDRRLVAVETELKLRKEKTA